MLVLRLLELANSYPELSPWAFAGVDAIGALYHLNDLRLQAPEGSLGRAAHHMQLQQAVQDNGNRAPADIAPFLPWAMGQARLAAMRAGHRLNGPIHVEGIDSS